MYKIHTGSPTPISVTWILSAGLLLFLSWSVPAGTVSVKSAIYACLNLVVVRLSPLSANSIFLLDAPPVANKFLIFCALFSLSVSNFVSIGYIFSSFVLETSHFRIILRFYAVFRIRDILVRTWILGSVPLTNGSRSGSGSCSFRQRPSRCQTK
jgi:hypothetical protein